MKFKMLSGDQAEEGGQVLLQLWWGSYCYIDTFQKLAVVHTRKHPFHIFYIINVHTDFNVYPEKPQFKISFVSKDWKLQHMSLMNFSFMKFEFCSTSTCNVNSPLYFNICAGAFAEALYHNTVNKNQDFQRQQ